MEINTEYPNGKQLFRGAQQVTPEVYNHYKENIEKEVMINLLRKLPIEKLKELLNFEMENPFDGKTPNSYEHAEYRNRLLDKRVIEFKVKIII